jgi:hypothetical protein
MTRSVKRASELSMETNNDSNMSVSSLMENNLSIVNDENSQTGLTNRTDSTNSTLNAIYENGKKGIFLPKQFEYGEIRKKYSPILNFYEHDTIFESKPTGKLNFRCLICKTKYRAKIGKSSNLNRHLVQDHLDNKQLTEWYTKYSEQNTKSKDGSCLDDNMLLLIKYFISSNNSLVELKNKYFQKLMKQAKITSPDYRTFVNNFLPKVMQQSHEAFLTKLEKSISISLITDIWTNKQLKDFIAVAANIIDEKFNKELLVIGFTRMSGRHCAENVKQGVESIVNKYSFDKSKISSNSFYIFAHFEKSIT